MSPDAVRILEASIQWLHPSVRDNVSRRYVSMVREFEYIVAKGSDDLRYLRIQKGWVDQKFYALFALNSFYQIAIGPHQASANPSSLKRIFAGLRSR